MRVGEIFSTRLWEYSLSFFHVPGLCVSLFLSGPCWWSNAGPSKVRPCLPNAVCYNRPSSYVMVPLILLLGVLLTPSITRWPGYDVRYPSRCRSIKRGCAPTFESPFPRLRPLSFLFFWRSVPRFPQKRAQGAFFQEQYDLLFSFKFFFSSPPLGWRVPM